MNNKVTIQRLITGVPGLDAILGGGRPTRMPVSDAVEGG